jgi:hypothetical protein
LSYPANPATKPEETMTDPVPYSQDNDLNRVVDELKSMVESSTSTSELERSLVDVVGRLWKALHSALHDIDLLKEEQRGWSRREMTIDQPSSPRPSDEGSEASRQWSRRDMEIDEPK